MKCLRWRMIWIRFPTNGHPGGPGGRLWDLGWCFFVWVQIVRRRNIAERRMMMSMSSIRVLFFFFGVRREECWLVFFLYVLGFVVRE